MKILHLIGQRPDSTGSGMYLQAMMAHATTMGYKNLLIAGIQEGIVPNLDDHSILDKNYVTFNTEDLDLEIVGMSDIMPYESRTFSSLSPQELESYLAAFTKALHSLIKVHSPDIIHSHHLLLVTSLAKQLFPKTPITTTCHGTDLRQFLNCPHLQDYILEGCKKIDKIMALSESQKDEISKLLFYDKKNISVVGGGFNSNLFKPGTKQDGTAHILYTGKLSSYKGVPNLLRSLANIKDLNFHFHMVGSSSGEQLENCLSLAKMLGDKVTVYGSLSQEKVSNLMAKCHLFVYPSFFEGLPLVILEALASGCLVLSTSLPGVSEIQQKTGTQKIDVIPMPDLQSIDTPHPYAVKPFEDELSKRLTKHIVSINSGDIPQLRTGNIDFFSWPMVFKRVQQVYTSIIKRP